MKGYFIPFGSRRIVSINKKIDLQIMQLAKISEVYEADVKVDISSKMKMLFFAIFRGSFPVDYSEAFSKICDPDYLFIRHAGADRQFVRFLRMIKGKYPTCTVIVEIPTYPYIKEKLSSPINWLLLPGELINQKKLKKYVDRFLVYSDEKSIFGVRTISSMNGVDVSKVDPILSELPQSINLIAVAHMQRYHGYERIIKGLVEYYHNTPQRKVELFLVGDGTEIKKYQKIVNDGKISDYVHFCGKLIGDELKNVFQKSSIAIETLGLYKDGREISTTIKLREYLAYGLPVICGNRVDLFEKHPFQYCLEVANNSSTIDIHNVIEFYDQVYLNHDRKEISQKIHQYALDYADISSSMKPLLDYLENNK